MTIGDARASETEQNLGLVHDDLMAATDGSFDVTKQSISASNSNRTGQSVHGSLRHQLKPVPEDCDYVCTQLWSGSSVSSRREGYLARIALECSEVPILIPRSSMLPKIRGEPGYAMPTRARTSKYPLNPPRSTLLQARKEYSKCAQIVEQRINAQGLTRNLSDRIIGIDIASDWLRRAAEMEQISYIGDHLNTSEHRDRFTEFIRYGFAWFGVNAIFSRRSLLTLVGNPSSEAEFARFKVLFNAGLVNDAAAIESELRALLDTLTITRLPDTPNGRSVTTLRAIHLKYIPSGTHHGACAAALASAASSGSAALLDLPTMLYGFRNWAVHGNALDGCFGSHPRFVRYVELLTTVLADVHVNAAQVLQARL